LGSPSWSPSAAFLLASTNGSARARAANTALRLGAEPGATLGEAELGGSLPSAHRRLARTDMLKRQ
jgi:hypothetical protein